MTEETKATETETEIQKTTKRDLLMIDPRCIIVNYENNLREDYSHVPSLELEIEANGFKNCDPIRVKKVPGKNEYVLVHGYSRMKATMNLINRGVNVGMIPAISVQQNYSRVDEITDHFKLNSGKNLNMLEKAKGIQEYLDLGKSKTEIAGILNVEPSYVTNLHKMMSLSPKITSMIINKQVSESTVLQLINAEKDVSKIETALEEAIEKVKETGKKVRPKDINSETIQISRVHRKFSTAVDVLKEKEVDPAIISKAKKLAKLTDETDPEKIAKKLLEILG